MKTFVFFYYYLSKKVPIFAVSTAGLAVFSVYEINNYLTQLTEFILCEMYTKVQACYRQSSALSLLRATIAQGLSLLLIERSCVRYPATTEWTPFVCLCTKDVDFNRPQHEANSSLLHSANS